MSPSVAPGYNLAKNKVAQETKLQINLITIFSLIKVRSPRLQSVEMRCCDE
jgi:hypothetical protein